MAHGQRPGGLTALAVLNFVFGGISVIWTLLVGLAAAVATGAVNNAEKMGGVVTEAKGSIALGYVYVALSLLSATLLLTSGVGYLKQKRFMGRTLGTMYALISLGGTAFGAIALSMNVGLFEIVLAVYPALTLILVNTTFKDDLVH